MVGFSILFGQLILAEANAYVVACNAQKSIRMSVSSQRKPSSSCRKSSDVPTAFKGHILLEQVQLVHAAHRLSRIEAQLDSACPR
jgi:hypothetical protein